MKSKQKKELIESARRFIEAEGEGILTSYEESSRLLLCWLEVLRTHFLTKTADKLLFAVSSSVREAAALSALGLVRPALFSLRAQADLLLSWLYFKDHPIEYDNLCRTGDGFVLKKEVLKYLSDYYPGFSERLGVLNATATRSELDVYRLLSAHVHSQSPFVIAEVKELKDIVRPKEISIQCALLQKDVGEYLNDILLSLGLLSEAATPEAISLSLIGRLKTQGQRSVMFK
ncbi:TPA: hypothetical protein ACSPLY_005253 [Pseudomonas aeruginosa]|uniref:hypothetical protein n=1 Tax=Pseudomonas aeruginosa TaxID=287 RepID=UPI0024B7813C|nr:hypothetical protein [Pseudomonas aeruginosa]MDI9671923.1 hypothetical protein [Pseudomonas aeruginosa]MDI9781235.1 hypothetical protein [Pseudomonas aeruginosa]